MGVADEFIIKNIQEDEAKFTSLRHQASSAQQDLTHHKGELAARLVATDQIVENKIGQIEAHILCLGAELQQVRSNASGGQGSGNDSSGFKSCRNSGPKKSNGANGKKKFVAISTPPRRA